MVRSMMISEKKVFFSVFLKAFGLHLRRVAKLFFHAAKLVGGGKIEKADYFVVNDAKVAYLVMPKAACSSIKKSMVSAEKGKKIDGESGIHGNRTIKEMTIRGRVDDPESLYIFTYVRNPFARIVSAYINKFEDMDRIRRSGFLYEDYLGGYLKISDSFEEYVEKVAKIPDRLCDRHFMSQSYLIDHLAPHKPIDVFKLEEIDQSYPLLIERFGFSDLNTSNKSAKYNYMDYYTNMDVLEAVRDRYQEDVDRFGYGPVFESIKAYIGKR